MVQHAVRANLAPLAVAAPREARSQGSHDNMYPAAVLFLLQRLPFGEDTNDAAFVVHRHQG